MRAVIARADVVVFNIGNHYNAMIPGGSTCMRGDLSNAMQAYYAIFKEEDAKRRAAASSSTHRPNTPAGSTADSEAHHRPRGVFIHRTQNPVHFNTSNSLYLESAGPSCVPKESTSFYSAISANNRMDILGRAFAARNKIPVIDSEGISGDHRMHPGYGRAAALGMRTVDCLHICRDVGVLTAWSAELLK